MEKKTPCRVCTARCPIVIEIDQAGRPVSARGELEVKKAPPPW